MLVAGSHALVSHALVSHGVIDRKPKDIDYICTQKEYDNYMDEFKDKIVDVQPKKYGFLVFRLGSTPVEFEIIEKRPSSEFFNQFNRIGGFSMLPLPILYALKMSHRFLKNSPHFLKTMRDIQAMEKMGVTIPEEAKEWYSARVKETYDYKHPVLNAKKDDFFRDTFYVWEHDSIHEAIKLNERPCYDYFKHDTADVMCSKDKFFAQPEHIRMGAVYEESCVLALERCLIPHNFKTEPHVAFLMALKTVCTYVTSGWFREYAWDNYDKAVEMFYELGETRFVDAYNKAKDENRLIPWVAPVTE